MIRDAVPSRRALAVVCLGAIFGAGIWASVSLAGPAATRVAAGPRLALTITPATKTTGLTASHLATISNPGDADVVDAVLSLNFDQNNPVVVGAIPFGGSCALDSQVLYHLVCTFPTIPAGASATMQITERLPVYVPYGRQDGALLTAANVPVSGGAAWNGQPQFNDRFWWCGVCSSLVISSNGWVIPGTTQGYSIGPDDTVYMADGVYIAPDGVLHWPDGRTLTVDLNSQEHYFDPNAPPPPPPTTTTTTTTTTTAAPTTATTTTTPVVTTPPPPPPTTMTTTTLPTATKSVHADPTHADPALTPGAYNPAVSALTIRRTICSAGWIATVRPPASYTTSLKLKQMRQYHESGPASHYVEDHLIPLELGGAPRAPKNLWPEPRGRASTVDQIETSLQRQVCGGSISLSAARRQIAKIKHTIG